LRKARYEILADDGSFYLEIPGFDGVFANAPTLEDCRLPSTMVCPAKVPRRFKGRTTTTVRGRLTRSHR
jgi:hypothetical protein